MDIVIRKIQEDELPVAIDGAREFITDAKLGEFKEEAFLKHWGDALRYGFGSMWVCFLDSVPACGLAGYISPDPNNGEIVFTEAFFYSVKGKEGYGSRLLKHVENELKNAGVIDRMYMFSRLDYMEDRVATLYHKMGYIAKEIFWEKVLN